MIHCVPRVVTDWEYGVFPSLSIPWVSVLRLREKATQDNITANRKEYLKQTLYQPVWPTYYVIHTKSFALLKGKPMFEFRMFFLNTHSKKVRYQLFIISSWSLMFIAKMELTRKYLRAMIFTLLKLDSLRKTALSLRFNWEGSSTSEHCKALVYGISSWLNCNHRQKLHFCQTIN